MQPLPGPRHHAALSSRTAFVKAFVITAIRGEQQASLVPVAGSFTHDSRRSMRWNGSLQVQLEEGSPYLQPIPQNLLTNFGTKINVDLGVELADGTTSTVPFGRYIVDQSRIEATRGARTVSMVLIDLSTAVAGYRFESPLLAPAGTDLGDVINAVFIDRLDVDPGLDDTGVLLSEPMIFGLEPSKDPWRELQDLVISFGYRLWYDRSGNLILDQTPQPDPQQATEIEGELTVAAAFETRPPNVMVARGEPISPGTQPFQSIAMDLDSTSPTYAGAGAGESAYGRITEFFVSPMIISGPQADQVAQQKLIEIVGGAATWQVSRPYDPTFDPDDVITVPFDDEIGRTLVVDAITLDLTGETSMACRAISTVVGEA